MAIPLMSMSFVVGLLIGLTGMGGAALMAPFLMLVLGVRPVTAVGTDLVYGAVTKIAGAWIHRRQNTVDMKIVRELAFGSIPGGLGGAALVLLLPRYTHEAEHYVRRGIGAVLVLVAMSLLARLVFHTRSPIDIKPLVLGNRGIAGWGVMVGFCVGSTSVGSGSLLTPVLTMLYPSRPAIVVGTDIFHGAILVSITGVLYSALGGVEWNLVPLLLAGSIPGVLLGSKLSVRISPRPLRIALAMVLLLSGYRML